MSAEESTLQTPSPTPTPAPQPPAAPAPAAEPAAPAVPAAPPTRRELLVKAFQNPRQRDETGKFVPSPKAPPEPQAAVAAPVAPVRPPMPKSLKKELESHWNTAPPELLAAVVQREADSERGVQPLKEKARIADELLREIQPYEHMIRAENGTPAVAIRQLLQTAALFRTGVPEQKARAVASLLQQFGIPLEHVQQVMSGQAPPQQALDPHFSQLAQQVEQLKLQSQQQAEARMLETVRAFEADPKHKYFSQVSERILQLVGVYPNLPPQEQLEKAYETAIWENPEIRQQMLAEQQAAERQTQQVAQAKQAAVQVNGAPAPGPAPKIDPRNRREVIAAAIRARR